MNEWLNENLAPIFRRVFEPVDRLVAAIPDGAAPYVARGCAVGLFLVTILWVFFGLRKEYLRVDAPGSKPWHDLRFWTIVGLLPHFIVYSLF